MTEEMLRASETVDIDPYEAEPEDIDRSGPQDDEPTGESLFADIESGEALGGLEVDPGIQETI